MVISMGQSLPAPPDFPMPDEAQLGPAMRALPSDRMRAFVVAMTSQAMRKKSYAAAAHEAGYTGSDQTLQVTGHRLAHDERIQAALREEGERRLGSLVPIATAALAEILIGGKTQSRLRAIQMVLNRTGLNEKTEHKVTVTRELTEQEQINEAISIAERLGIDAKLLLGQAGVKLPNAPVTVDAEYTDVTPADGQAQEDFL